MAMGEKGRGWVRKPIGSGEDASPPAAREDAVRSAAPAAPDAAGEAEPGRTGRVATFIDQGADFSGTLRLRGSFRIDSEFRGSIESTGEVIVGEAAGVEADIRAREVVIAGAVVGDVVASRQLVLRSGARLHGDVETPCLEIGKGAFFNGRTRMVRPEVSARSVADAPAPAASGDGDAAGAAGPLRESAGAAPRV